MNGVELTSRLREIRSDIPIILCTGFSEMIDDDKARNMGISAYIMKPILKGEIGIFGILGFSKTNIHFEDREFDPKVANGHAEQLFGKSAA